MVIYVPRLCALNISRETEGNNENLTLETKTLFKARKSH